MASTNCSSEVRTFGTQLPSHILEELPDPDSRGAAFRPSSHSLRDELKGGHVSRPNDGEMEPIQGGDGRHLQPLGNCHDRGVHGSQWEVFVRPHQLSYPYHVRLRWMLDEELRRCQRCQEDGLRMWPMPACQEIRDLSHDEGGHQQWTMGPLEQPATTDVMGVRAVGARVQDASVEDDRARTGPRRSRRGSGRPVHWCPCNRWQKAL